MQVAYDLVVTEVRFARLHRPGNLVHESCEESIYSPGLGDELRCPHSIHGMILGPAKTAWDKKYE